MKKILFFTLALLLATACKETPHYTIAGNTGQAGDTLYIFGLDSIHDVIEEIICDEQGAFSHRINTDTVVPAGLLMPDGELITLFAEPGIDALLIADTIAGNKWLVKGGKEQALYDSIAGVLARAENNSKRQVHIEEFTYAHPFSNTNVEIIRRFMVDRPHPNNSFILSRIRSLGGTLQDHEFFTELQERIDNKNSNTLYKLFPTFNFTTDKGKKIASKDYKEKMYIVNFWAAWDSVSRTQMKEISKLYAKKDTSRVRMLNISLDYDTALWKRCIAEDNIAGDNVCDGKAWNGEIAKRFNLSNLTFTLVVSPYQRIDLFELSTENFSAATDSLAEKYFKERDKKKKSKKNSRNR